jgi:UDP:flavonoid glycosyltransferase YjiC (YdhE family)
MRIQFAVCGVGLGHAGRCIPIAKGLQSRYDNMQIFFSTYRDAVNYVRKEGYPTYEVKAMGFRVKTDGTVDFRRTALNPGPFRAPVSFLKQVEREIQIMMTLKPDVVVSDSRASAIVAARILSTPILCILNQFQVIIPRKTHLLRLAKFADAATLAIIGKIWTSGIEVMIPDFPSPFTISTDNLRIPSSYQKKTRLVGPILPVRPETLPSKQELRKKLGLKEEKIVIFAPISGPIEERTYLTSVLRKALANIPEDFEVVMSLGYPKSTANPIQKSRLRIFNWIPNRFEYMKACDIVISRAGHGTILQTICYGKPTILIPTPSHTEQMNNAKKGVALGVALSVKQDKISRKVLLSTIKEIVKNERFSNRVQQIKDSVSQWDGLETAIQTILSIGNGGRSCVYA